MSTQTEIPVRLKSIIIVQIIMDLILGVNLFFFQEYFIKFSGWKNLDPFAMRLIAAGLFAVALQLFLKRNGSIEVYITLLNIKITTLGLAATGAIITMIDNFSQPIIAEWILLAGTTIPFTQLVFWKVKLNKLIKV